MPSTATTSAARSPRVRLAGMMLDAVTERQCIERIVRASSGGWVVTANLDHLRRHTIDHEYAAICNEASMVVADGMPLVWASRLQGTPLPERVAGSDLISDLSAAAAQAQKSVFLLGGDSGAADGAAEVLRRRYPGLRVVDTICPPLRFEHDPQQMNEIRRRLVHASPDIVYVALGSPKQERFIRRMREHVPNAWWLGVGISFSFLTGDVARAPGWMQRLGMEWLHRVYQEPRRLARRYFVDGIPFALRMFATALAHRLTHRPQ